MAKCTAFLVDGSGRLDCERHLAHTNDHQATARKGIITWVAKGDKTQLVGQSIAPKQQEVTK